MISSETGIPSDKLRKGTLDNTEWQKLVSMTGKLSSAPVYIDDTPSLSVFDLRSKCRRLKAMYNIEMIVIDYLQLMRSDVDAKSGNREQEISTISRSLKAIAKELNVPVIALSQLSRAVETRGTTKRPQLSDLRESGAIEQDADMVILLHRPDGFERDDPRAGEADLILGKHRGGPTATIMLAHQLDRCRFVDMARG